jgi:hypothetical protein
MNRPAHNVVEPRHVHLYTTMASDGHGHIAIFDEFGNGQTTVDAGHSHPVRYLEVTSAKGHSHELTAERAPDEASI